MCIKETPGKLIKLLAAFISAAPDFGMGFTFLLFSVFLKTVYKKHEAFLSSEKIYIFIFILKPKAT